MHFSNFIAVSQLLAASVVTAGPLIKRQTTANAAQGACVAEPFFNGGNGRALTDAMTTSSAMSVEYCASFCSAYTYFGVEYSSECYCGNVLQASSTIESDNTNCQATCAGNSSEFCGGSGHMNFYASSGFIISSTTSSSTAASTSSVAASSSSVQSSVASSTSSVAPTTTAVSSTTVVTTSSMVIPSTTSTTTKASTTLTTVTSSTAAKTSSTTSTAAATATATSTFFSLASCPSFQASLSNWNLPFVFTPYYNGAGFTESSVNPGNLVPSLLPAQTYTISGKYTACQAVQQCLNQMDSLTFAYLSFDLHYLTTSSSWQCTAYAGNNLLPSFFNVANTAVSHAYGFNGILKL